MLSKIREILLTQYIGTVLIALLACNAVITLVSTILRNIGWSIRHQHLGSVVAASDPFNYGNLVFSLVTILLYLLVAYLLSRWLFPSASPLVTEGTDNPSGGPAQL